MGRRSLTGGVRAKGDDRIEFTFVYKGQRYRPTLPRTPSEANLRRARLQLAEIKLRIKQGTFVFGEEFPDYRYTDELRDTPETGSGGSRDAANQERTCTTRAGV
jgi:Arm DNA-binding domain